MVRFEKEVFPWLGCSPIDAIGAPFQLPILRREEAQGNVGTAHRTKDACGQRLRYGIATGRCSRNAAVDLRGALQPVKTRHTANIADPKKVGDLLRLCDGYTGQPTTRAALQLPPLAFQRPGNLRQMERVQLDLEAAVWTIPAAKMKRTLHRKENGRPHFALLASSHWRSCASCSR